MPEVCFVPRDDGASCQSSSVGIDQPTFELDVPFLKSCKQVAVGRSFGDVEDHSLPADVLPERAEEAAFDLHVARYFGGVLLGVGGMLLGVGGMLLGVGGMLLGVGGMLLGVGGMLLGVGGMLLGVGG